MLMTAPIPPKWKPEWQWRFEDHPIGWGVWAFGEGRSQVLLPLGLSDEQRDVILRACEIAWRQGVAEGKAAKSQEIMKALGSN